MKEAKIADVKNNLSRYLQLVRRGHTVRILDRATPIAQLVPISAPSAQGRPGAEALADMARKGLIRAAQAPLPASFLTVRLPGRASRSVAKLVDERSER